MQQLLRSDQRKSLCKAQINATQEELVGFILDEIIAEHGEFYYESNKPLPTRPTAPTGSTRGSSRRPSRGRKSYARKC